MNQRALLRASPFWIKYRLEYFIIHPDESGCLRRRFLAFCGYHRHRIAHHFHCIAFGDQYWLVGDSWAITVNPFDVPGSYDSYDSIQVQRGPRIYSGHPSMGMGTAEGFCMEHTRQGQIPAELDPPRYQVLTIEKGNRLPYVFVPTHLHFLLVPLKPIPRLPQSGRSFRTDRDCRKWPL